MLIQSFSVFNQKNEDLNLVPQLIHNKGILFLKIFTTEYTGYSEKDKTLFGIGI